MLTITAIIRARTGSESVLREALLEMARHAQANEPDTVDYHVAQDEADPRVFTTFERYTDQAAMDRHNGSDALARFFEAVKGHLDGDAVIIKARELSAKRPG